MDAYVDNRGGVTGGTIDFWGLTESPFASLCDPRWFYQSGPHEEALARLLFTLENRRRLAVMVGPRGTGKSVTLAVFAHTVRRSGGDVCLVDLTGKSADDLAWSLATTLRLGLSVEVSTAHAWRRIEEHLDGRREARLPATLICDHIGNAERSAQLAVERLLRAEEGSRALSVVLAGKSGELASNCLDLADVRIQLEPLDLRETHAYVTNLLDAAGASRPIFSHEALDELYEISGGIPRDMNRIAELALLAGQAEAASQVTESILRNAAAEARVERVRRRPVRELVTS